MSDENLVLVAKRPLPSRQAQPMTLYFPSLAASIVFQAPACGPERFFNCCLKILLFPVQLQTFPDARFARLPRTLTQRGRALHHDLATRKHEINTNVVQTPVPVMPVRDFDHHATAYRALVESFELSCLGTDPIFDDD
jgi:hypothetical protein